MFRLLHTDLDKKDIRIKIDKLPVVESSRMRDLLDKYEELENNENIDFYND